MSASPFNSRGLAATLVVWALSSGLTAGADNYGLMKDRPAVTTPPPQYKSSDSALDCPRSSHDPRCRPPAPEYRPHPGYRRPLIINQVPAAQPLDTSTLKDDWDGCRTAKLSAMRSRGAGNLEQANHIDEWLWKNCHSYSVELRDLEQDQM